MKRCPNCLSDQLTDCSTTASEPYIQCAICGSRFEESDLIAIPEIVVNLYPADVIELENE
jgi:transcription elongation factor Elf1